MRETIYPDLEKQLNRNMDAAGALVVPARSAYHTSLEPADLFVMVFCNRSEIHGCVASYMVGHWRVKEIWMQFSRLTADILAGEEPWTVHWLLDGDVLYDPDHRVRQLCSFVRRFPEDLRRKKSCVEFSRLLRYYMESKNYLKEGFNLDAYVSVQHTLQYWARLVVIDAGDYPRVQLWRQVQPLNTGVYKLYKELVDGRETVEQRSRLVLLAAEYSILSRMEHYCRYVLDLLGSGAGVWTVKELHDRLQLEQMNLDLTLLLEELVKRSYIEEVVFMEEEVGEQRYRLAPKE
ncbi:nucleotidyltransferase-like protein [Paludifilum halophilum]|nr:nucleotidyltransferase-like protein [Paludifilum halophilum]